MTPGPGKPAASPRAPRQTATHAQPRRNRQTAITVTDFVARYGSSASGPPSDP